MSRTANLNKPKKNPLDGYKTYDPSVEGYGNSFQWRQEFNKRIGIDAAREAVGDDSPHGILGVALSATWNEIKKAWRKLIMVFHPDNQVTGNASMFRKIQGAYEILEMRFGK